MIFGLSVHAFTQLHVAISLVGIATGLLFVIGLLGGRWWGLPNLLFLVFTILTSVTGFFFPVATLTPAFVVGVISLVILAVALLALFVFHRAGWWRPIYTITALLGLWLNVFVLIVQSFLKIPALHALAPSGNEPPFGAVQGITLILFVVAGWRLLRKPVT